MSGITSSSAWKAIRSFVEKDAAESHFGSLQALLCGFVLPGQKNEVRNGARAKTQK